MKFSGFSPRVTLPNCPEQRTIISHMQFNYEIPADEFVAAQIALHTAKNKRRLIKKALGYMLLGVVFALVALFRYPDLGPLSLLLVAAHFISVGITNLFPQRSFRKAYPLSQLEGKSYQAELDESGFLVSGDSCSWRVAWSEVHLKGENKRVFFFYAKGTIFIFGKKYLTDEQQRDIRRFI
jgi:hypothetical protein